MKNLNATQSVRPNFWENIDMTEMTQPEWEALCDGCGKCCLLKLEDEDTNEVKFTNVACRLFDDSTCRCQNYASVSYTHLRAHETGRNLVCRLLLEKKKKNNKNTFFINNFLHQHNT